MRRRGARSATRTRQISGSCRLGSAHAGRVTSRLLGPPIYQLIVITSLSCRRLILVEERQSSPFKRLKELLPIDSARRSSGDVAVKVDAKVLRWPSCPFFNPAPDDVVVRRILDCAGHGSHPLRDPMLFPFSRRVGYSNTSIPNQSLNANSKLHSVFGGYPFGCLAGPIAGERIC